MQTLIFDNRFRTLPGEHGDPVASRQVWNALWSEARPTRMPAPTLLAASSSVAGALGWSADDVATPTFAEVFAGNVLLPGMQPWASNYGGHQFGAWAGQLGDGRAISLGEVIGADGSRYELQLKGAGLTPYSRRGDGRAVLRSSLREFVCSEAMHALGVPTTRALSLVATGEGVLRDMLYNGRAAHEPGAIVCRVAPSFLRFGHFELPSARGDFALLRTLWDFMVERDFAELTDQPDRDIAVFHAICERTALMIAHWMRIGFVHGVMNTDNFSVLGLTLDYGPFGWMEEYNPDWTPNTTDARERRYRFGEQPNVAHWNLSCLAGALSSIIDDHDGLREGLRRYVRRFNLEHTRMNQAKLGLLTWRSEDAELLQRLYRQLHASRLDFTLFFRQLMRVDMRDLQVAEFASASYDIAEFEREASALQAWLQSWSVRVRADTLDETHAEFASKEAMRLSNPCYLPRNWLLQQAIQSAEQQDLAPLHDLLRVLQRPYDEQADASAYAQRRPEWANDLPGCTVLSCSS